MRRTRSAATDVVLSGTALENGERGRNPAGRAVRSDHGVLALQRAAGNAATARLVAAVRTGPAEPRRAGWGGRTIAPELVLGALAGSALGTGRDLVPVQRDIQGTIASLQARTRGLQAPREGILANGFDHLARILIEFDRFMTDNKIGYRFGGSMAAFIQGAGRPPMDIDVEVTNQENMKTLARVMTGQDSGWSGQVIPIGPQTGVLNVSHRNVPGITFDIVNETIPQLPHSGAVKETMEIDAGRVPTGGIVPSAELIFNYLDRMISKPDTARAKGDDRQIAELLAGAGVRTYEGCSRFWAERLDQIVEGHVSNEKARRMREILEIIARERFGPPAPASAATVASGAGAPR